MLKRRSISWLLSAAFLILLSTGTNQLFAQACGPFVDVAATDAFCPFILQAFIDNVTQGTSPTTFGPVDSVNREQSVTFFDRVLDQSLHRATIRAAIGKTWAPTSTNAVVATDVGGGIDDIVTDGVFLWLARVDGKILKVNAADRRLIETWSIPSGIPRKLGLFAGLVWIADDQGALYNFNPTNPAGAASALFPSGSLTGGFPALAFDGTNVWLGSSSGTKILVYPVGTAQGFTFIPGAGNIQGMVFDGTNMWVLQSNSVLLKMTVPPAPGAPGAAETLALPGPVTDCRMLFDGSNIWIPSGNGLVFVVRPTLNIASLPSSVVLNQAVAGVGFPYVASFDGEYVMIGGVTNGTVALYKATNLAFIRTIVTGATGVRGIASDGRTFNVGDYLGTKFFQF